jgi:hypothetical protein
MKTAILDTLISLMPAIVSVLYAIAAIAYIVKKDYTWATVWASYAMANFALILIGLRK